MSEPPGVCSLLAVLLAGCAGAGDAPAPGVAPPAAAARARCSPTASCSSRRSIARATSWRCSSGCAWAAATRRRTSSGSRTTSSTCSSRARRRARPARSTRLHRGPRRQQQRVHLVRLHALRRGGARRSLRAGASSCSPTSRSTRASSPAELESEKKVVFEEMNVLQDDPDKVLTRRLYGGRLRRAHPYGRPILGTRELVRRSPATSSTAYYKKHYVPRNMVLVVVGAGDAGRRRAAGRGDLRQARGPPRPRAGRCRADARARRLAPATTCRVRSSRPTSAWRGRRARGGRRGHLAVGPADLHPRRRSQLAAEPACCARSEGLVQSIDASYVTARAVGHRHRHRPPGRQEPRRGGGRDPRRHPAGARRGRDRGRAPARHHHRRVVLRVRHRDGRGAGQDLRPGRDDVDACRTSCSTCRACARSPPPQIQAGRAQVPRRRQLRARALPAGGRASESGPRAAARRAAGRGPGRVRAPAPAQAPDEAVRSARLRQRVHRRSCARTRWRRWSRCRFLVRMGTRWETPTTPGISNFTHAVMVKGTTKRSGGDLAETVASLGGKISASGRRGLLRDPAPRAGPLLARAARDHRRAGAVAPAGAGRGRRASATGCCRRMQRRRDNAPVARLRRALRRCCTALIPTGCRASARRASLERIDHAAHRGVVPRLLSAGAHDAGGERAGLAPTRCSRRRAASSAACRGARRAARSRRSRRPRRPAAAA